MSEAANEIERLRSELNGKDAEIARLKTDYDNALSGLAHCRKRYLTAEAIIRDLVAALTMLRLGYYLDGEALVPILSDADAVLARAREAGYGEHAE